jgi:hypothetical protein
LISSDGIGQAQFDTGTNELVVLNSQPELDAFLQRHPQAKPQPFSPPPGYPSPYPSPQMPGTPPGLVDVDFSKYQLIAHFLGSVTPGVHSRIVRIEDTGDRLVAHPVRWNPAGSPTGPVELRPSVHILALPRTAKPITFAPLEEVQLKVMGPPGPDGGDPEAYPRWKAVPNPELTREVLEASYRQRYGSSLQNLKLEKRTFASLKNEPLLGSLPGWGYTDDSDVWYVVLEGNLVSPFPGPTTTARDGDGAPHMARMTMLLSIETGVELTVIGSLS